MAHLVPSIAPNYESLGWVVTGYPKRVSIDALRIKAKELNLNPNRFTKYSRLFSFEGLTLQVEAIEQFALDHYKEYKAKREKVFNTCN